MGLAGKEIYRTYDRFGVVRVLDDGNKRILAFGEDDEQSCMLKSEPLRPQHEYTRAMLLALLFSPDPRRVLSLGLGAGSLNTCLHHRFPSLRQQVAELRPAVIEVAQRYFDLPHSRRLQVFEADAGEYLAARPERRVDLVFSDIYGAEGLDLQQLSDQFLSRCHDHLKVQGWLVLNCWREHQGSDTLEQLLMLFDEVWGCALQSGNWVVFAGKNTPDVSANEIKRRQRLLEQQLGFSLSGGLNRLKRYA